MDAGYGHIAPKTALGRVMTIIYATFGIPLTLLTIAQVGGYMAAVFRFIYKNLVCGLGAGVCTCCRSDAATDDSHVVTENPHDVTAHTTADQQHSDKSCSSLSPTHNHLTVEDHERSEGQVEGHEECKDDVSRHSGTNDELVELKIIKGKHLTRRQ